MTIIKQASLQDKNAIWEFLKTAYEHEEHGFSKLKYPERWIWQFQKNPCLRHGPENKLPIWIAVKDGKIAGQVCSTPCELVMGDKKFDATWPTDGITLATCRGEGISSRLQNTIFENYPVALAISMAPISRKIWDKAGGIEIDPLYNFYYPVSADSHALYRYLKKRTRNRPRLHRLIMLACNYFYFHGVLSAGGTIAIIIRDLIKKRPKSKPQTTINEINGFDHSIDELLHKTRYDYTATVGRNSRYLNWRFFENTQMDYHAFIAKTGNDTRGYMVLRKPHPLEIGIGVIADFYTTKKDIETFKELIRHAIGYFGKSVTSIKCCSSVEEYKNIFKKLGFIELSHYQPLVICSPAMREELKGKTRGWFLTAMDHDVDQIIPY